MWHKTPLRMGLGFSHVILGKSLPILALFHVCALKGLELEEIQTLSQPFQ